MYELCVCMLCVNSMYVYLLLNLMYELCVYMLCVNSMYVYLLLNLIYKLCICMLLDTDCVFFQLNTDCVIYSLVTGELTSAYTSLRTDNINTPIAIRVYSNNRWITSSHPLLLWSTITMDEWYHHTCGYYSPQLLSIATVTYGSVPSTVSVGGSVDDYCTCPRVIRRTTGVLDSTTELRGVLFEP
jgi:hypothetical protein